MIGIHNAIVGNKFGGLASVDDWTTKGIPNILKNPTISVELPRKSRVGQDNYWLESNEDAGDRLRDTILPFARGVNPMVEVQFQNSGSTLTNNRQTSLPYKIQAFRPPIVKQEDVLPLSRLPRLSTAMTTLAKKASNVRPYNKSNELKTIRLNVNYNSSKWPKPFRESEQQIVKLSKGFSNASSVRAIDVETRSSLLSNDGVTKLDSSTIDKTNPTVTVFLKQCNLQPENTQNRSLKTFAFQTIEQEHKPNAVVVDDRVRSLFNVETNLSNPLMQNKKFEESLPNERRAGLNLRRKTAMIGDLDTKRSFQSLPTNTNTLDYYKQKDEHETSIQNPINIQYENTKKYAAFDPSIIKKDGNDVVVDLENVYAAKAPLKVNRLSMDTEIGMRANYANTFQKRVNVASGGNVRIQQRNPLSLKDVKIVRTNEKSLNDLDIDRIMPKSKPRDVSQYGYTVS
jgi:hypothetical protein